MPLQIVPDTLEIDHLDSNTDIVPGTDNTNSGRVQILEAVNALKAFLDGYGGTELYGTGNDATLAKVNAINSFSVDQHVVKASAALILNALSANPGIFLRENGVDAGSLVKDAVSNVLTLAAAGAGSFIQLFDTGNIVLGPNADNVFRGSPVAGNKLLVADDLAGVPSNADWFVGTRNVFGDINDYAIDTGFGTNAFTWGIAGIGAGTACTISGYSANNGHQSMDFNGGGTVNQAGTSVAVGSINLRASVGSVSRNIRVWAKRD